MARIGTTYDKEINQKVFVVRGDERYTRTTETVLSAGTVTQNTTYYTVPFTVNVYRNTGNSTVTFYDNGEVINITTCNTSDATLNVSLNLEYGVEHNIYVRYNANNQCTPSKSFIWTDERTNPNLVATSLSVTGDTAFLPTSTASTTVKLDKASGDASLSSLSIDYSVDGSSYSTTTTNSSGVATLSLGTLSNGVHTVTVYFGGNSSLASSSLDFQVSSGYNVEIIEYPSTFFTIMDWTHNDIVKVKVMDQLSNPVSSASVSFDEVTETTGSDGVAVFELHGLGAGTYYATYGDYTSNTVTIGETEITGITFSQSNVVESGVGADCTWKLDGTGDMSGLPLYVEYPVPVYDSDTDTTTYESRTFEMVSDENGEYSYNYGGYGIGSTTHIIKSMEDSSYYLDASLKDYAQYWKKPNRSQNATTYASYCALKFVSSGFKIEASSGIHRGAMTFTNLPDNFEMTFDIKAVTNSAGIYFNNRTTPYSFKSGQSIKITQNNKTGVVYVNGASIGSQTSDEKNTLKIWVNYNQSNANSQITFDNLRILKV